MSWNLGCNFRTGQVKVLLAVNHYHWSRAHTYTCLFHDLRCQWTRFRLVLKKGPNMIHNLFIITSTILHSSTSLIQFYIWPPFAICNLQIQTLCCVIDFTIWYTQSKLVPHESVYISACTRPIYYLNKAFVYSQNTRINDYVI